MARDQTPRSAHRPDHPESRRSRLEAGVTKSLGPNVDAPSTGTGPPAADIPGYTVLRELSRGGQAVVFQALQKSTHRKVAVKVLLEGPYASAAAKHRFDREVELASHLKHPHIMAVYDSGVTAGGQPYYVMDYVRGVPITQYVHDNKLDVRHVLELFATACDAVNHAHQKGVIHRDLKPSNMLVDAEGNLHILDFGLAKSVTDRQESLVTVTGQLMGTLPYMSPEQTRGNPDLVDTRTDVYSLGIVLYVMLTGCYPYPVVGELSDVLHHIADTEPHSLAKAWASHQGFGVPDPKHRRTHLRCPLSGDLEVIVLKSLSKERERRYQSAGELAADVRAYLAGEPIHAKHDSGMYLLKKTLRRYRVQATFAGLLLLLLVILFPVVLASRSRALAAESVAMQARDEEASQREFAQSQVRRAVEAENTVTAERTKAELRLAESLVMEGDAFMNEGFFSKARVSYMEASTLAKKLGRSTVPALAGWLESYAHALPLLGRDGARVGPGGFEIEPTVSGTKVVITADGRTAISRDDTSILRVWDLRTGTPIRTIHCKYGGVYTFALSQDGAFLAVGFGEQGAVFDYRTGKELRTLTGPKGAFCRAAFSPDGKYILTAITDGTTRLWDAATGRELRCFKLERGNATEVAFSPDGRQLAYGNSHRGGITVWPVASETGASRILGDPFSEPVQSIAFCPDGKTLLAGHTAGELCLWDLESGKLIRTLHGHRGMFATVAVSPDGTKACSGGRDGTARVWDLRSGTQLRCLEAGDTVSAAFTPDGSKVLTGSRDGTLHLWDIASSHRPPFLPDSSSLPCAAIVSSDGRLGLSEISSCHLVLWDTATGQEIRTLVGQVAGGIQSAFSPDQRTILSGASDGIRIWDVESGRQIRTLPGHDAAFANVAFSADGFTGIASGWDRVARVVDIAAGKERLALVDRAGEVSGAAILPDGLSALTTSRCGDIRYWDLRTGQETRTFRETDNDGILCMALSKDGTRLFTGQLMLCTIKLLDPATGAAIRTYVGHLGPLASVAVSPDGGTLASYGRDGTVRLWDVESGAQWRSLRAGSPGQVGSVTFMGNNHSILYSTLNGSETRLIQLDLSMMDKCLELEPKVVKAREALQNNANDGNALRTFGEWWAFRNQPAWAAEMLEAARANGADVSPLMLARAYWKLGRLNEAGAEFARAIERKEAPEAYLTLCRNAVLSKQPAQD